MKGFPLIVDADMLRKFSRYELGYDELTQGRKDVVFDDYRMEINDFYEAFKAMKKSKTSRREFLDNWFTHIYYDLYEELELGRFDSIKAIRYLTYSKDEEIVYCIVEWCRNEQEIFAINHDMTAVPDYNSIIKSIETYRANKGLQFEDRKFTLSMKYAMVKRVGNPTTINDASDVTVKLYKKFVNDLCKANVSFGYRVKGFSLLTGTKCFKANKKQALDIFLKLYEATEDAYIADIIGDLYYGGTEQTEPCLELAYQYYTISGLNGNQSSILKMSDMLCRGKGTVKNEHVGKIMVFNLFDEAYKDFCRYNPNSLLADVTVRMGMIFDSGIDTAEDIMEACKFYNIARYAIKKRINHAHNPADQMLYDDVCRRFSELSKEIGSNPNASYVFAEVPNMLLACMVDNYVVHVTITKVKNEYKLVSSRIPKVNEDRAQGVLIEYPLSEYCALLEEVEEYFPCKGSKIWLADESKNTFLCEEMTYVKDKKECVFKFQENVVARIKTSMFSCKLKREET